MTIKDQFNQFFAKDNGRPIEVNDPSNYAQCLDLAYDFCDFISVPRITIQHYFAYQVYTQPNDETIKYFELIPNTPKGLPQVGDMVIFSNKLGVAGHISIATGKGDTDSFETFDQNWGTSKSCHLVTHNYDAVLGWLRLRVPCPELVITDQTPIPQITDENGNVLQVQAIRSKINDMGLANASLTKEVSYLQAKVYELESVVNQPSNQNTGSSGTITVEVPISSTTAGVPTTEANSTSSPTSTTISHQNWLVRLWNYLFKRGVN